MEQIFKVLIFTDLDGSLLDRDTFKFDEIKDYLKKLKKFHFNKVRVKGYSFFMYAIYLLKKFTYSIKEIPIIFHERAYGKSKIPKIETFRTLLTLFLIKINYFD